MTAKRRMSYNITKKTIEAIEKEDERLANDINL